MSKILEDFGNKVAKGAVKEAVKEESEKTIMTLLKSGMSVEWIHDTLKYPVKMIEQVQKSIS